MTDLTWGPVYESSAMDGQYVDGLVQDCGISSASALENHSLALISIWLCSDKTADYANKQANNLLSNFCWLLSNTTYKSCWTDMLLMDEWTDGQTDMILSLYFLHCGGN